ncbi:hypothetical protein [Nostoc sp. TCL26-01]|uniref:hypothetical protein n=1 Tax=Nostoc sp. TCL26-01 TaxID=2576904 RepID=UPI0015B7F249|nr:hypothetical protein [Nostoc sp. TCL26-01]QLE54834.1 discoidin domain-containing protein [Nostoc sp. TCL26-01]QLE58762.1 discoidin domain-containing protein [Nostoc sp. TCL26-01]
MKLNEYPELLQLSENDLLLGWDSVNAIVSVIRVSTLRDYLGVEPPADNTLPTLVFSEFGDNKGMCYWLATRLDDNWSNPHTSGELTVISNGGGVANLASIVDRTTGGGNYPASAQNAYWGVDFKTHKLKVTDYIIRHDANSGYALRSWKLQGSNNGIDWIDIHSQTNNTTLNNPFDWLRVSVTGVTTAYKIFKLVMTAPNSAGTYEFCCSELEFYGEVQAI